MPGIDRSNYIGNNRALLSWVIDMRMRIKSFLTRIIATHREGESKLIRDAQEYWNNSSNPLLAGDSHWRGNGPFQNDALWLKLGSEHLSLLRNAAQWANETLAGSVIVEWGCGGGMNAIQLAPMAKRYYGVDISKNNLNECSRQMQQEGFSNFTGIHIDSENPEAAGSLIETECDAFICTYVFELLPTPEYGLRVLTVAHGLLRHRGIALIQIRYNNGEHEQRSLRFGYKKHPALMTTYLIEEFWRKCVAAGFNPLFVTLLPDQPELHENRYAYFALQKL
jgi:SAM-dependent methyltransferase